MAKKKDAPAVEAPFKQVNDIVETGLTKLKRMQHANLQPIKTDADYALRGVTLREVQALVKAATEERTNIVKPINEGVKRINEFFKKLTAPAEEFANELKQSMVDFQEQKRQAALKEAEAQAKKLEKKSPEAAQDLRNAAAVRQVVPPVEGVQFRRTWTFEITDESLVPREFLVIDEAKLRKYAQAMQDTAKVPGVHFFQTTGIAASAS